MCSSDATGSPQQVAVHGDTEWDSTRVTDHRSLEFNDEVGVGGDSGFTLCPSDPGPVTTVLCPVNQALTEDP